VLAAGLLIASAGRSADLTVASERAALRSQCADDAAQVAELPKGQIVSLRFSLAGADSRCYSVSADVDGRKVQGFLPKDAVDGADEFEEARREAAASGSFVAVVWGGELKLPANKKAAQAPSRRGDPLLGRPAADFSLSDLSGRAYRLGSLRGKVVVLDFWASWCGPCRRSMPQIEALHREFARKGLVVLGVNSEDPDAASKYLREKGYSFPTLMDKTGTVGNQFNVKGIPTSVVIDRTGKVSAYLVGAGTEDRLRTAVIRAGL
jgi:thiol-disulfide isomerase/thioredoxin